MSISPGISHLAGYAPPPAAGRTPKRTDRPPPRAARTRLFDATCFTISALLAISLTQWQIRTGTPALATASAFASAVSCLALWWRRRRPVEIAAGLGALTFFFPAAQLPALICLGTVAARRPVRPLVLVAAIHVTATVARLTYRNPDFQVAIKSYSPLSWEIQAIAVPADRSGTLYSLLISAVVVACGMSLRARRQLIASLRERAERAEAEQRLRIHQARAAERARIAREMHDVLAHRISLISLQAGALQVTGRRTPQDVIESAVVIRNNAHQALNELREIIGVLHTDEADDSPLTPQPTLADIPALVAESVRAGMRVSFEKDVADSRYGVPDQVARTAYRVVQEGLTNARKHAPDAPASVTLRRAGPTALHVEIRNPRPARSPGTSRLPGSGQGLVGLTERANLIGGRLEHGWTPEGDFRLAVHLPLPEQT